MTAPLQVIALSFSRGAGAEDSDAQAEVNRLRGRGVLRLLDMLFVAKSQDGSIEQLAVGNDEDFGSLLAAVVPVANGGPVGPAPAGAPAGFDPADARALADSLQPGTALAFLLVEHHWAATLFDAIAETGGTLIGEGFADLRDRARGGSRGRSHGGGVSGDRPGPGRGGRRLAHGGGSQSRSSRGSS